MQSRRDQMQAYRFLTRRALAALVAGEPDLPEAPMRRLSITTITGIMVAILVAAGFAVAGFLRPGSSTTISSGTIYIERDTGAQFVLMGDDKLHPALNYASAVLAAGGGRGQVGIKTVPTSVLAQKPHGAPIGIPGLPQSLPRSKSGLVGTPWTICSKTRQPSVDNNVVSVSVAVGSDAGAHRLPPDAAAVVTTQARHDYYLLWHGMRLEILGVANALNLQTSQAVVVGASLLNALPVGPPLQVPKIPNAGHPGPAVGGKQARVGQLIHITDDNSYRVVLSDGGVATVKPMWAQLLRTVPLLDGRPLNPITTTEAVAFGLPPSNVGDQELKQFNNLPSTVPQVPDSLAQAGGVCVEYDGSSQSSLGYPSGSTAPTSGAITEADQAHAQQGVADSVEVPAGKAALVWDHRSATRYIVAPPGMRFAVNSADLGTFGFGGVTPLTLPAQWLNLLPKGPALDGCKIKVCN